MTTSLSVLDLVHVSSGQTAAEAIRNAVDLAQRVEAAGYQRYWLAEHHLNPGVAGISPALLSLHILSNTERLRVGSAASLMGHRTALQVVEEFGLLDALHPGRVDLGLGRSGGRPPASGPGTGGPLRSQVVDGKFPNGLVIPKGPDLSALLKSPRFLLQKHLLLQAGSTPQPYGELVDDVLSLIAGTYKSPEGEPVHIVPGEGADLQLWILGSSGGESAEVAGARGIRFGTNYHVNPAGVLDAVDSYREHFVPSDELDRPYVVVSADVVVAPTEAEARELATGYGLWVKGIRNAEGAIPFPTPEDARRYEWSEQDRALVKDRVDTQFVGSPSQVADQLEVLRDAIGADEIVLTTITHDHADRVRSFELIAEEWARRS